MAGQDPPSDGYGSFFTVGRDYLFGLVKALAL
jgi:hypothetical protein